MRDRPVDAIAYARRVLAAARGETEVEKTIWGSPAGKKRLADRLVAMLPAHKTYVEPFAGSGAVLFAKDAYERVNGFSNQYWGWGFEDADLNGRTLVRQIPFARRSGRFKTLPHDNEGFDVAGRTVSPSASHVKNKQQFESRFGVEPAYDPNIAAPENVGRSMMEGDGLSDLTYTILSRETLVDAKPGFFAEKVVVAL